MKKKLLKSKIVALVSLAGLGIFGITKASTYSLLDYTNDIVKGIVEKFISTSKERPEDRVYLHFDKPFYKPGESVWFKAYVRDGANLKASNQSEIVHIELINPKGSIEKTIHLICKNGFASGDFSLEEAAAGGLYKIKAYTNWQKNESLFFEKVLQVQSVVLPRLKMKLDFERKAYGASDEVVALLSLQTNENKSLSNYPYSYSVSLNGTKISENKGTADNEGKSSIKFKLPSKLTSNDGLLNVSISYEGTSESISRSIPIQLNTFTLNFFPEGGELLVGTTNRLAFKALNEFGKAADIEGTIYDGQNNAVSNFKTFHQGMGAIDFVPQKGERYTAKISKPENINGTYALPDALEKGYALRVNKQENETLPLEIFSTEKEELSIVAQIRGQVVYSKSFTAPEGKYALSIPVSNLSSGVAQITLFDSRGIERAERLAFVNKDKQLKISVETDKQKYQPREKVTMSIKVCDHRGIPMPSQFSLSVVDDKLLSFADDKQDNILSSLLLSYDLKEKIEEPSFYFNPSEAKATEALDYLLLTSGWRRFTWQQIQNDQLPSIEYLGEKAIISGKILDQMTGKAITGATVSIANTMHKTTTDKEGNYSLANVDLSVLSTLEIKATGYYPQQMQIAEYTSNGLTYLYSSNSINRYNTIPSPTGAVERGAGMERGIVRKKNMDNIDFNEMDLMEDNIPFQMEAKAENKKEAKPIKVNLANAQIMDKRIMIAADAKIRMKDDFAGEMEEEIVLEPLTVKYYRARVFTSPSYAATQQPEIRTDFRSTIYWNGNLQTDRTGKTTISFYNSDEITSFRAIVEGIAQDGTIGRVEATYFTQLPFSMDVKVPTEVTSGDLLTIPLILKNNTNAVLSGTLGVKNPKGLTPIGTYPTSVSIAANQSKTLFLEYKTGTSIGKDTLEFKFNGMGLSDAFTKEISISAKGFPASVSLSGNEKEKEFEFEIKNLVEGSIKAEFNAYPNVVSDLMKGIESILREPYGCFEQTSTSNYPNVMIKQYLEEMKEGEAPKRIEDLLSSGYKRLTSYETKEKGYEWFGGTPAHEGLTAYGLMQFNDMKQVYNQVDGAMIDRTTAWLLSRRDGEGGFKRSSQALDQFGRANPEVTNAYIVYALSETGNKEIRKELDKVYAKAMESKDPYQLALAANALFNFKDEKNATKAMDVLMKLQQKDGSWNGTTHSITYSQGNSLVVETTSLTILAMLKSGNPDGGKLNEGVKYLLSARSGHGGFSSTQGTVLALKALTQYAKFSKKTDESGTIEVLVDGKKVAEKEYQAGERGAIRIDGIDGAFTQGKHTVKIRFKKSNNALPYSMSLQWNTSLPQNDAACKVALTTQLGTKSTFVGETVRLTTTLKNITKEGLPMTMAIVGIPAGLSAQPWQLKELLDKKKVDFYEIRNNTVFFYYRQMLPEEAKVIELDLKAEVSGEYEAQASSAYLYYTNEYKVWSAPGKISIRKK